ncbi:hypothetical protein E4U32_003840 [Claviceps aff. humidiphila group G2b]|nr:hypothetical protein E4U32_003840 [Claviceps aff. humidiphila group G2b]
MSRLSVIALRLLQTLLAVGTLGVSAYVVNWHRTITSQTPPGSIDYLLSASIISMVSILYLEISPRFFRRVAHPYATLTVEGLNTVLYFAGFIAIAVHVGSLTLCNSTACRATRGDSVLAAAGFCAWIASATLTAKQMIVGGSATQSKTGDTQVQEVQHESA